MSNIKVDDLRPPLHSACSLEGQSSKELTTEEMQALRGGAAAPAPQGATPSCTVPGMDDLWRLANEAPGRSAATEPLARRNFDVQYHDYYSYHVIYKVA